MYKMDKSKKTKIRTTSVASLLATFLGFPGFKITRFSFDMKNIQRVYLAKLFI